MSATMYVRNLPADTAEDDVREALQNHAMLELIEFMEDTNPNTDRKMARVVFDMPRYDVEELATRFDGRIINGEPIACFVPLSE